MYHKEVNKFYKMVPNNLENNINSEDKNIVTELKIGRIYKNYKVNFLNKHQY